MSQKFTGVYSKQFFINLFAAVKKFGTIYVVSDGNVYTVEGSAKDRCLDGILLHKIKYYAVITEANCPVSGAEMETLWRTMQDIEQEVEVLVPQEKALDLDAAQIAYEERLALQAKPKVGKQK